MYGWMFFPYTHTAEQVTAPILALGGDVDPRCPPEQLPDWAPYTTAGTSSLRPPLFPYHIHHPPFPSISSLSLHTDCEVKVFPGGHFFLKDKEAELLSYLTEKINEAVEA